MTNTPKFIAEKILNIKHLQDGNKMVLIKWKNLSIQQATWQPQNKRDNIQQLILEYENKRINDRVRNYALKQTQNISFGQNPYQQTQRYGHFMYGDQPECIESIKVFQNQQDSQQRTTILCEIKWKLRQQVDQNGVVSLVLLENTFMDSRAIDQFRPEFLIKNYQRLICLNVVSQ